MFTFFFTVEVLVKILGLGAWHFFSENAFNRFDFLLVALALVELFTLVIYDAYDPRPSSEYGDGASEPFFYSSYSSYSNSSSASTSDYDAYAESSDDASFVNSPQSEVLAVLSYLKALRTFRVFKMFQYLSSLRVIGEGTSPYGFPKLGRRRVCFAECSPVRYSRDAVRNTNTFGKHFRETLSVFRISPGELAVELRVNRGVVVSVHDRLRDRGVARVWRYGTFPELSRPTHTAFAIAHARPASWTSYDQKGLFPSRLLPLPVYVIPWSTVFPIPDIPWSTGPDPFPIPDIHIPDIHAAPETDTFFFTISGANQSAPFVYGVDDPQLGGRASFDTFYLSIITVFQVLTLEGTYVELRKTHPCADFRPYAVRNVLLPNPNPVSLFGRLRSPVCSRASRNTDTFGYPIFRLGVHHVPHRELRRVEQVGFYLPNPGLPLCPYKTLTTFLSQSQFPFFRGLGDCREVHVSYPVPRGDDGSV